MRNVVLLLVLALAFTPIAQTGKYTEVNGLSPLPTYTVRAIKGGIEIDGRLSEQAWQQAALLTLIFPWDVQTGRKQRTVVKLLRDDENLYVAFACDDTDITARYENRDDPVARDDCVEVFIRPDEAADSYFGLEVSAKGVLLDYLYPFPNAINKGFNFTDVRLKTAVAGTLNQSDDTDKGWSLELAIPLRNFSSGTGSALLKRGQPWRMQFNRWDGTEADGRRLSMWCHSGLTRPRPHNPERFGTVVFE